jgi:hypothetical protein
MMGLAHLAPSVGKRFSSRDIIGDWAFVRLDDTGLMEKTAEAFIVQELDPSRFDAMQLQLERVFFRLPVLAGVGVKNAAALDKFVGEMLGMAGLLFGPFDRERLPAYRGVPVTRVRARDDSWLVKTLNPPGTPNSERVRPMLMWAHLDGAWYASSREALLHEAIDRELFRRRLVGPPRPEHQVNATAYLSPGALNGGLMGSAQYLEWINFKRALGNEPLWRALFEARVLDEHLDEPQMRRTALRLLSFMPVSPEGKTYSFDPKRDEVVNARHGSLRQPRLHLPNDGDSPFADIPQRFKSANAEVTFLDDGLSAVIDIDRRP